MRLLILTAEWTLGYAIPASLLPYPFLPPTPSSPGDWVTLDLATSCSWLPLLRDMELWRQLWQAGLVPPGLGPPPQALRGIPPVGRAGQTLMSPAVDTKGARESLLWIWEELGNLRRVDVQLLGQLCSLGLEMRVLREELVTFLEEEEEEESIKEEEEDEEPEGKQEEGHLVVSCPTQSHRLPDFEMTI
ncbi:PREDICTED: glutamate-rich protein 4 [Ceratotherium simum simum]|uniref:Glutamate-rich protein 4 n=1 Tax=Ceratotherium simum simum TaxID=73337 RepID=A0ABM0I6V5_CERSS|nr:PREDICTED: glutamate-rich protein 4 [Ceratotherium simum simum]